MPPRHPDTSTPPIPLVDVGAQYLAHKDAIDAAIARVIASGVFILGPEVQAFEEAFASYCRARHAVGVGSGTAAIELVLRALGIGPGDEVITTPFTFMASAEAISQAGATPVFADIDPDTYNLDAGAVSAAVTPRTRAIVPVHLYGQPAEMDSLAAVAQRHGLALIEDAAQAHGAEYRGRRVGNLAGAACFSFYPGKNLGAYGDGGAVVTDDTALAARVRKLRDHGRSSKYVHDELGWGHRLDALQAAILAAKLSHLDVANAARRAKSELYQELLAGADLALPFEPAHVRSVFHLYVVRVSPRDAVLAHLRAAGIGAGIHYPLPLHLQPAYAALDYRLGSLPVAESAARRVLSLPIYPELVPDQQERVAAVLKEALGRYR